LNDIEEAVRKNNYTNTGLVLYKNAGVDLHRLELKVEDYVPFYESMTNIFTALKFIHSKGILHRDLKSDNLISQKNADGSFTTRLIDVGFMCSLKPIEGAAHSAELNAIQERFQDACTFDYVRKKARTYGPFYEFVFGTPDDAKKKSRIAEYKEGKDFSTVYENWVNDVSKYLGSDDPFKKEDGTPAYRYSDVMDALTEVWTGNEDKYFKTEDSRHPTVSLEFILQLASSVDVFCFGMVLAKLQYRYLAHSVDRRDGVLKTFVPRSTILKNAGAPEIWVAVEDLARFGVPAQEAAWHVAVGNRISIPIHTLMTRMSTLDPSKAIPLTEALRDYTEILTAVRELYIPIKVYKGLKAVDEYADLESPVAGLSAKRSSPKAAAASVAKAATPKPAAPTSTRKLKLSDSDKKTLAKKKKALEKAKKEAKEDLEEAQGEVSDARKKHRELEDKLDKAKRDKMAGKVITDYEKAIRMYNVILQRAVERLEEVKEETRDAINAAHTAYIAFREGLPRRTAST
jgi:serine/threonine protein kinase